MVKRTSLESADCPVARSLDAIGDWWSLLIIAMRSSAAAASASSEKTSGLPRTFSRRGCARWSSAHSDDGPASDGSAYLEYVLTPKGRGRVSYPGGAAAMDRGVRRGARRDRDHPGRSRQGPPGPEACAACAGRPACSALPTSRSSPGRPRSAAGMRAPEPPSA